MSPSEARLARGALIARRALSAHQLPGSESQPAQGPTIDRIAVEGLFGRYDYRIPSEGSLADQRLLILYGDNGSGKTTILELIYNLLSPAKARRHRTNIANVAFRQFKIWLTDGSSISADRESADVGTFVVTIEAGGEIVLCAEFEVEDGRVPVPRNGELVEQSRAYTEVMDRLGFYPYYLADDRNIHSDRLPVDDDDEHWRREELLYVRRHGRRHARVREDDPELSRALDATSALFSWQVIRGSSSGFASANSIYLDVARRIARYGDAPIAEHESDLRESLLHTIEALDRRADLHETYELVPRFPAQELGAVVAGTSDDALPLLEEILSPFLDGLTARLDALQGAADLIETFVSNVNAFLRDKSLEYSPRSGLSIVTESDARIPAASLSSGERQLLLLLSSVIRARHDTRLFIIDEPELSLNVKWQRRLFESLIECSTGTDIQFIIATHSVEMVSGYADSVVRLDTR